MKYSKYKKEIIFILDLFIIIIVSTVLFLVFPENNGTGSNRIYALLPHLFLFILCEINFQYIFKTYDSLWRYAESREYLILILAGLTGYLLYLLLDYAVFSSPIAPLFTLAVYSLSLLGMLSLRFFYRFYRKIGSRSSINDNKEMISLIIIGAGEAGVKLYEEIETNPNSSYRMKYFIDDSPDKIGKKVHGIPVKGPIAELDGLFNNSPADEIVIAMPSASLIKQNEVMDLCSNIRCHVQILPNTLELLKNNQKNELWKCVRNIEIEELLGREPVWLDNSDLKCFLYNKTVMVTGGGGSIGSELCRQIAKVHPKMLVIVDIYENNAYEIQQELIQQYEDGLNLKIEIASVRNKNKIYQLFERHHPDIVFHAAAHKHVPLMEDCPEEAVRNNIFGTYNMVLASEKYKVEKFILISTDKAVNPTNIMGASKRFCEMILQSRKGSSKTEFVAVRFGNVLGSNGSVIPLFQKQIARGGPVTVTDKRIVRFIMTIPEAVQLVLQASYMANNAEIYVLDMGKPVKIIELAEKLIRMSGYEPYTDIPIVETGLRPGEKLYEELHMNSKDLTATANRKIFIEPQDKISKMVIRYKLILLSQSLETKSPAKIKSVLMKVVPTYHSPKEVNAKIIR